MAVDPELLAILACPACDPRPPVTLCPLEAGAAAQVVEKYRDKFRDEEPVVTDGLHCAACGRVYPIVSDIPVMLVEEALPAGARAS
ncbi:MAG TPA: Trm112 family protein [Thermoanaerobaculia bacterium]|nr:Trm112 family protein [Thermoanaerobaculia bacterium]